MTLLGTCLIVVAMSQTVASGSSNPPNASTAECNSIATCYSPQQIQVAYGVTPLLARGIDGRGETVVLPELAYPVANLPVSDLRQDMKKFDVLFGLPAAKLTFDDSLARVSQPWLANGEEVLDAEMVHTVAPGATISIVLVAANSLNTVSNAVTASIAAIRWGVTHGAIISISAAGQTGGEHCDSQAQVTRLHAALQLAARRHVTVVAASGDVGSVGEPCDVIRGLIGGPFAPVEEVNLPAADPLVLGAGGTSLSAGHATGTYESEIGWGLPDGNPNTQFQGSGGGFSLQWPRPAYQNGVPGPGAGRGVPDVSADASPSKAMAIVTSSGAGFTIRNSGGTSASAPIWAGIIALADQYAGRHLGDVNPAIYAIGRSASYHQAFHDVIKGQNAPTFAGHAITGYTARAGWDPVTGWGSPDAQYLVPLLAHMDQG